MSTQDFRSEAAYQYEPIVDIADLDYRHAKRAQSPSKARRNVPREVSAEHIICHCKELKNINVW